MYLYNSEQDEKNISKLHYKNKDMRILFTLLLLHVNLTFFAQGDKHSLGLNLLMPNMVQIQYEYQVKDNFRMALGHSPLNLYRHQSMTMYLKSFSFSLAAAHTLFRTGKSKRNKFLISGGAYYGYDGNAKYPSAKFLRESNDFTPFLSTYSVKNDIAFYSGLSYELAVFDLFSMEFFLNWYLFSNPYYNYAHSWILRPIPFPAFTFKRNFSKRKVKKHTEDDF